MVPGLPRDGPGFRRDRLSVASASADHFDAVSRFDVRKFDVWANLPKAAPRGYVLHEERRVEIHELEAAVTRGEARRDRHRERGFHHAADHQTEGVATRRGDHVRGPPDPALGKLDLHDV